MGFFPRQGRGLNDVNLASLSQKTMFSMIFWERNNDSYLDKSPKYNIIRVV